MTNWLKQYGVKIAILLGILFIAPHFVFAHPGNTAADGCHYCRTNCSKWGVPWNVRHCHGGYVVPASTPKPTPIPTPRPTPRQIPVTTPKSTPKPSITTTPTAEMMIKVSESVTPAASISEVQEPAKKPNWLVRFFRLLFK